MRITIQVRSGPLEGHRYALATGQQLLFGRTGECDVSFPNDNRMSSRHFQLVVDNVGCRIRDLDTTNGTLVNDEAVSLAMLQAGDRIIAGSTEFAVTSDQGVDVKPPEPVFREKPKPAKAAPKLKAANVEGTFLVQLCKSNVHCYRGSTGESPPQSLASGLSRTSSPVLSLDLSKVDERFQQSSELNQPLHDWLPEEVQTENPHVLWTTPEQIGDFSIIGDAWGKDAVVTIYYPPSDPIPLEQIRRCAGIYCRPSIVRPLLSDTTEDQVSDFMKGIDAVLIEDDDPESWLLYSQHDLREVLIAAGLTEHVGPTEQAGPTGNLSSTGNPEQPIEGE